MRRVIEGTIVEAELEERPAGSWAAQEARNLRDFLLRYINDHMAWHSRERDEETQRVIAVREGVETALTAVRQQAVIHAEAHNKEHYAHERIHEVEKEARAKADQVLDKRLDMMNEIRAQLNAQAATFLTREHYEEAHKALVDRVEQVRDGQTMLVPRELFEQTIRSRVAEREGAHAALTIRVDALEKRALLIEGRSRGIGSVGALVAAGITLSVLIVNLIFYLISR